MEAPHPTGNSRSLSYWIDSTPQTSYPPLAEDVDVDVAIVGAGIAGITAAYLLAKEGKSVVVLDRERIAMAETGHTTAHLQIVIDTRLSDLVPRFGFDYTKKAWDSQLESVRLIEQIARDERIECELTRLDAYLYTPHERERRLLKEERRLARKMGYECEWAETGEIPYRDAKHAIRFPDQGKFHVRKYLLGLVKRMQQLGVRFYEGTEVVEIESGTPAKVRTREGHTLTGQWVLQTTNMPFDRRFRMHSKLFPYRTYVIGAKVPKGIFGHALYWDTLDPYHYVRVEPKLDHDYVIVGGEDHKVGSDVDTLARYDELEKFLGQATEQYDVVHRWSGEVVETADDLPLIGQVPGSAENELMFTGDSGTGMTNGTLAGLMMAERVLGRGTPWDELFDPKRVTLEKGPIKEWVKENVDNTAHLLGTLLAPGEVDDVDDIEEGEGAILRKGMRKYAVARREDGTLAACSALCTHMGCTVSWNKSETSWDCPCHGSRFTPEGEILHGPAVHPLKPVEMAEVIGDVKEEDARARRG